MIPSRECSRRTHDDTHDRRARPHPHRGADRARAEAPGRPHLRLARAVRAGAAVPVGRRGVRVPGTGPVADLPVARRRLPRVGRRRERDDRLPQRLRLDGAGPRASGDRRRSARACRARDAFCRADGGRRRRRRGARAQVRAAPLAIRELWHRGDDGCDPDRTRHNRPRHDHQDLRLVPRPSRLRDGLDRRAVRADRRSSALPVAALRRRDPGSCRRDDGRGPVQRRRGDGTAHPTARRRRAAAGVRD